jgi:hypothetical protein
MSKFGNTQYLIDRPEPSEILKQAANIAGNQLQEQFSGFNKGEVNSSYDGFKWIKTELTFPSFDHLTFAYKNSVFSVVIELIDNNGTSLSPQVLERLLKACVENNLLPCIFRIRVESKSSNFFNRITLKSKQATYELVPFENGWNLLDARNNQKLDPSIFSTEIRTKMSRWELSNFAVQVVRNNVEKEGNQVLSFCDLPEINPQIWFKDTKGYVCWLIVKHVINEGELDYREWVGLENRTPQLLPYDGYFASVQFLSTNTDSTTELYRGDAMYINFKGLERIYIS